MLVAIAMLIIGSIVAALLWRQSDRRHDINAWRRLAATAPSDSASFQPEMVAGLPEPAQRYFRFAIRPGTPLHTIAEIVMIGEIGRGSHDDPDYSSMRARQILAPPYGFVWQVETDALAGSDGALPERSWTRFWLFGIVPVVRASGPDHRRSAFGRTVAEAAFWSPASLLPSASVRWESVGANTARAIVRHDGLEQAVEITVSANGAPRQVLIQRWSNENRERVFRLQPFGGVCAEFREFSGFRLPTRVEGGNHFGTDDYFAFFRAEVTALEFPDAVTGR